MDFERDLDELREVLDASRSLSETIAAAGSVVLKSLATGGKLLTCGNGGSAADALHLAEELVGRYKAERRPLPAICLNADVTALTCIANDYGYAEVFSRQVQALGRPGDVLVGFSTSGRSENVNRAFERAKEVGVTTILLGGKDGGEARELCDVSIVVPSQSTARIQEVHALVFHHWLERVDGEKW